MTFEPVRVAKGWGYELWAANSSLYCGKKLVFSPGTKCSLHYHEKKNETFYIQGGEGLLLISRQFAPGQLDVHFPKGLRIDSLKGTEFTDTWSRAKEILDLQVIPLFAGEIIPIPPRTVHQIISRSGLELFEFSTEHFDEDSYRIMRGTTL